MCFYVEITISIQNFYLIYIHYLLKWNAIKLKIYIDRFELNFINLIGWNEVTRLD
jgi:hypothetical protein